MRPSCTHLRLVTGLKTRGAAQIHCPVCPHGLHNDWFTFTLQDILWFLCLSCLCMLLEWLNKRICLLANSDVLHILSHPTPLFNLTGTYPAQLKQVVTHFLNNWYWVWWNGVNVRLFLYIFQRLFVKHTKKTGEYMKIFQPSALP